VAEGYGEDVSAVRLSEAERLRLFVWAGAAASAAFAWNLFVATSDPADLDPKWLLIGIGMTLAAVGVTGGSIVPRRKASWLDLVLECGVGAGAISVGCVFGTAWAEENHPAALGFWGILTFIASAVVIAPFFLAALAARSGLLRVFQRA
jgi:hypothetical protein